MKKDIASQFVKNVRTLLPCGRREKKRLLADFEVLVSQYAEDNQVERLEDLYEHFGTPEEVALTYPDAPAGNRRKFKIFFAASLAFIFVVVAAIAVVNTMDYIASQDYRNGYYVEVIRTERNDNFNPRTNAIESYPEAKN